MTHAFHTYLKTEQRPRADQFLSAEKNEQICLWEFPSDKEAGLFRTPQQQMLSNVLTFEQHAFSFSRIGLVAFISLLMLSSCFALLSVFNTFSLQLMLILPLLLVFSVFVTQALTKQKISLTMSHGGLKVQIKLSQIGSLNPLQRHYKITKHGKIIATIKQSWLHPKRLILLQEETQLHPIKKMYAGKFAIQDANKLYNHLNETSNRFSKANRLGKFTEDQDDMIIVDQNNKVGAVLTSAINRELIFSPDIKHNEQRACYWFIAFLYQNK